MNDPADDKRNALHQLGLWGLLASWEQVCSAPWLDELIAFERAERQRRSLERRVRAARLGVFKPLADFDWRWPKKIDRAAIDELCSLDFLAERANVVLVGPNSCGKTTIAKNLAHLALLAGHSVRFVSASAMLTDLAGCESTAALERRFGRYCRPALLVIDELGYLAYDARFADLLFEVVSRRYLRASTIVTTNRTIDEWISLFDDPILAQSAIDRLAHNAYRVVIEGDSYRKRQRPGQAESVAPPRKPRRRRGALN